MNKELEEALKCFDKVDNTINLNWQKGFLRVGIDVRNRSDCNDEKEMTNCLNTIKTTLLKAQEQEEVLEIIWNKKVDLWRLHFSKTLEDYNTYIMKTGGFTFTQEEFELLKRWLNEKNL